MGATSLKFKDQNYKFNTTIVPGAIASGRDRVAVSGPRSLREPDTAVPFFLGYYAGMGRDMESARGFFEVLAPVYYSQRQGSALSLAVLAIASEILHLWRHGSSSFHVSRKSYVQAVVSLRSAVQDDIERGKPATVLAVLALQLYENIAAVYGLRPATSIHHNGAVSLLAFADSDHVDSMTKAYIRRFILHVEISSAMRQKRPLQSIAYSWIGSREMTATPDNPSAALDAIGASVADFQATYVQLSNQNSSWPLSLQGLRGWLAEAKRIDAQLLAWARSVPDHWQPLKLKSGQDIDPSIPTYRSVCEVYPTCQIASIWDLWRSQRLLLVKIALGSLDTVLCMDPSELTQDQISARVEDFVVYKNSLQELVDSVCYSVPFYLGNRTKLSSLADFTDPAILLPSYRSMVPLDKMRLDKQHHEPRMTSRDEHKNHIIARGPWHVMNPLSHLITLFLEDRGPLLAGFLRPGQLEWICKQFLRAMTLIHLSPAESDNRTERWGLPNPSVQGNVDAKAVYLAMGVRKGAMFLSGL
jgi:hypothetical protein